MTVNLFQKSNPHHGAVGLVADEHLIRERAERSVVSHVTPLADCPIFL